MDAFEDPGSSTKLFGLIDKILAGTFLLALLTTVLCATLVFQPSSENAHWKETFGCFITRVKYADAEECLPCSANHPDSIAIVRRSLVNSGSGFGSGTGSASGPGSGSTSGSGSGSVSGSGSGSGSESGSGFDFRRPFVNRSDWIGAFSSGSGWSGSGWSGSGWSGSGWSGSGWSGSGSEFSNHIRPFGPDTFHIGLFGQPWWWTLNGGRPLPYNSYLTIIAALDSAGSGSGSGSGFIESGSGFLDDQEEDWWEDEWQTIQEGVEDVIDASGLDETPSSGSEEETEDTCPAFPCLQVTVRYVPQEGMRSDDPLSYLRSGMLHVNADEKKNYGSCFASSCHDDYFVNQENIAEWAKRFYRAKRKKENLKCFYSDEFSDAGHLVLETGTYHNHYVQSILWPSLVACSCITLLVVHIAFKLRNNNASKKSDTDTMYHHFSRSALPSREKATVSPLPDVDDIHSSAPPTYKEALNCPVRNTRPADQATDTMAPVGSNSVDLQKLQPEKQKSQASVDANDEIQLVIQETGIAPLPSRNLLVVGSLPPLRHAAPLPPIRPKSTFTGHV